MLARVGVLSSWEGKDVVERARRARMVVAIVCDGGYAAVMNFRGGGVLGGCLVIYFF